MSVKQNYIFWTLLSLLIFVVAFRASLTQNVETFVQNVYTADTSTALNFFNDKQNKYNSEITSQATDCSLNPNIIECHNKQHAFNYKVYNDKVQKQVSKSQNKIQNEKVDEKVPQTKERVCPPQITLEDLEYEYVTEEERLLEERKEEIQAEINELEEKHKELKNQMDESKRDFDDQIRMQENIQRDISANTARESSGSVKKVVDEQVSPLAKIIQTTSEKVEAMQKDFSKLKDLPGEFGPLKDGIKEIRERVARFIGQK
jgi:hypothetical protein